MAGNLEASCDRRDCEIGDTDTGNGLLEADSIVNSTENNPEENTGSKEKKEREKLNNVKAESEIQSMDQINIDVKSTESTAQGNVTGKRKRESGIRDEIKRKREFHSSDSNHGSTGCRDIAIIEGKCSAEGGSIISTYNVKQRCWPPSASVDEAECLSQDLGYSPRITPTPSINRKLIVLDVNGLLASIVMPAPRGFRADEHILGRAIFKRPFCDDFLKFCFQNFDVGVWSSRAKKIIERVVDYLLGDYTDRLLFCWDMSHSTQTGFHTLENIHKPLVFKELRKIWVNDDPSLPWKTGDYHETNTLLLDDSPYKALLNPLHTAIFPKSFHYKDSNDNSLGPGGDLRVYLEGLLHSENVQNYVEQHPFGQSAINETNLSWPFYSGVLQNMPKPLQDIPPAFNLR